YFIPPQIWAWGRRRIKIIKECVDLVISFFPFERSIYEAYGVRCEFVGHPYANSLAPSYEKEKFFEEFSIPKGNPIIALFPGSREEEVKRHMPYFRDLIKRLEELLSHPFFIFAKAQSVDEREIKKYIRSFPNVRIIENLSKDILFFSDFAILASGSATLEAALAGVPSVVIYRLSFISYHVAKFLVKVPYVSLPNILLGEEIFPEFIQNLDTQKIAVTIRDMLKREMKKKMEEQKAKIRSLLTLPDGDPYRIASLKIVDLIREKYGSVPEAN
ncbi:MAG: hypothetical protein NZ583_08590, partial [Desulfobacterota bacterium]|nr:hypothetical protein [Thermodesulfobacteriota bacterium]